jgi:glyoxylase-like metal-dependent hydrolase (beta-lactamase superfamily II)
MDELSAPAPLPPVGPIATGGGHTAPNYRHAAIETGRTLPVGAGVHWVRLPLPFAPSHINCWVLDDGDGWTIVDTGYEYTDAARVWEELFAGPFAAKPVRRVVCTHMHPDHAGLAGWLTQRWNCPLWMSAQEYLMCRALLTDVAQEPPADGVGFYLAAGAGERAGSIYRKRFGPYRTGFSGLPASYRRMRAGQRLPIGPSDWQVVMTSGHSPEHACLWNEALDLFISGDQVLPRYWSNVTVLPIEPDADPLADWIESLHRIRLSVPDSVTVLPSHGEPFTGLHARVEALVGGHERNLLALLGALSAPKRAADVLDTLFAWPIRGETSLGMAIGESVAHLAWLVRRGFATRSTDADGVHWYQAAPAGAALTAIDWDRTATSA